MHLARHGRVTRGGPRVGAPAGGATSGDKLALDASTRDTVYASQHRRTYIRLYSVIHLDSFSPPVHGTARLLSYSLLFFGGSGFSLNALKKKKHCKV